MHIKVKGGTVNASEPSLCSNCQYRTRFRTESNREVVRCEMFEQNIVEKVVECDQYFQQGMLGVWQLKDRAWILQENAKGKMVFIPYHKLSREDAQKVMEGVDT